MNRFLAKQMMQLERKYANFLIILPRYLNQYVLSISLRMPRRHCNMDNKSPL